MLEETEAGAGHVYLVDRRGEFAAAASGGGVADEAMLQALRGYLEPELRETTTGASTVPETLAGGGSPRAEFSVQGARYEPFLLWHRADGRRTVTGVAVIAIPDDGLRAPASDVMRAISTCLQGADPSIGVIADG